MPWLINDSVPPPFAQQFAGVSPWLEAFWAPTIFLVAVAPTNVLASQASPTWRFIRTRQWSTLWTVF